MRIGGLASGMDIDELVKNLMNAERAPLNKLYQKKTTYEWQRDAYRSVNTKIKTFDTYIADNFILKSFTSKTATSSNSDLVSAIATGKASGTLTIEGVSQLATSARGLGSHIDANGSTKLSSLFESNNETMPKEIKLNAIDAQGKLVDPVTIKIDEDMTIDDFVKKINSSNAGVSAIFEGNRLSITAKNTGREINGNDAISTDENGSAIFAKLGLSDLVTEEGKNAIFKVNGIATERTSNSFSINGYNVTLKNTFNSAATINGKLTSAFTERKNAQTDFDIKKAQHEAAQGKHNTTLDDFIKNNLSPDQITNYTAHGELLSKLDEAMFDKLKVAISNSSTTEEVINQLTEDDGFTEDIKKQLASIKFEDLQPISIISESDFSAISAFSKLDQTYTKANKQALKELSDLVSTGVSFEEIANEINNLDFSKKDPLEGISNEKLKTALSKLGTDSLKSLQNVSKENLELMSQLADKELTLNTAKDDFDNANARLKNADASFKQLYKEQIYKGNEAEFESKYKEYWDGPESSTAPQVPEDTTTVPAVTLTSTTNVDEMITRIEEFVNTYNGLIKDLTAQTKETKYRDYPPLTNEQKEGMSESEIKLWEEKAKSGLLRNDALMREGLSNMRSLVYQSHPALKDSKYNSLYSIGITTTKNYNDGGTLEIDKDKLRKALEEDPDAVEKLFKNSDGKEKDIVEVQENGQTVKKEVDTRGFLYNLRSSMRTFELSIEKKAGRSTMTDSQYIIGKNLVDTDKRIDTWKLKLENIESRYWKQFTAMEQAINKANSQASIFSSGQ